MFRLAFVMAVGLIAVTSVGCNIEGLGNRLADRQVDRLISGFGADSLEAVAEVARKQGGSTASAGKWQALDDNDHTVQTTFTSFESASPILSPAKAQAEANPNPRVLYFLSRHCGPCGPKLAVCQAALPKVGWKMGVDCDADFQIVWIEDAPYYADMYGIDASPTFVLVTPEGQELARAGEELQEPAKLADWLNNARLGNDRTKVVEISQRVALQNVPCVTSQPVVFYSRPVYHARPFAIFRGGWFPGKRIICFFRNGGIFRRRR